MDDAELKSVPLSNTRWELYAQARVRGLSRKDSARDAGYSDNAGTYQLEHNEEIKARIVALLDQAAREATLSRAWVLEKMAKNARIALGEEKTITSGPPRVVVREVDGVDTLVTESMESYVYQRDAGAANRALELIGKEFGMFVQQTDVTIKKKVTDLSDAELADIAAGSGGGTAEAPGYKN